MSPVFHIINSRSIFIISESTQFENLGDIILNSVLARKLAQHGELVTLRSRARLPSCLNQVLQEVATARLSPISLLKYVMHQRVQGRCQVLCLNPGGVSGDLSVTWLLRAGMYTLTRAIGIRLMRVGVSFGPLSAGRRKLEAVVMRMTAVVAVRDRLSLEELPVVVRQRICLLPDLALLAEDLQISPRGCDSRTYLAVSLRLHGKAERAERYRRLVPALGTLASAHGLKLLFVAQVRQDRPLLAELARASGANLRVLDADEEEVPARVKELYASCAALVTNRLHAGIFAAMNGCVPLALIDPATDRKILGLLREAKLSALIHDEAEPDAALVARMDAVLAGRDVHAARIDRLVRIASQRGERLLDRLILSLTSKLTYARAAASLERPAAKTA